MTATNAAKESQLILLSGAPEEIRTPDPQIGLVIRYKPTRQPHHLNITRSFTFEPSTRLNP